MNNLSTPNLAEYKLKLEAYTESKGPVPLGDAVSNSGTQRLLEGSLCTAAESFIA